MNLEQHLNKIQMMEVRVTHQQNLPEYFVDVEYRRLLGPGEENSQQIAFQLLFTQLNLF